MFATSGRAEAGGTALEPKWRRTEDEKIPELLGVP